MSIGVRKAVAGTALTALGMVVAAPVAFWFVTLAIDRHLGLGQVLPVHVCLILAAAAVLIGLFWMFWAHSYLVFLGKGLPLEAFGRALHPTSALVTTGPYAYTRNPMVLGFLFMLLGTALVRGSVSGLVMVPIIAAAIMLHYVEFEDKALVKRFGADFEQYRANVPLLIPRLSAYVHTPIANT